MKKEIDYAVELFHAIAFGTKIHGNKYISESKLASFITIMTDILFTRYEGHWHPADPERGSGYRCIRVNGQCLDPLISKCLKLADIDMPKDIITQELTVWVDPGAVSFRIGEDGSIGCETLDEEVYMNGLSLKVANFETPDVEYSVLYVDSILWSSLYSSKEVDNTLWSSLYSPKEVDSKLWSYLYWPKEVDSIILSSLYSPKEIDSMLLSSLYSPKEVDSMLMSSLFSFKEEDNTDKKNNIVMFGVPEQETSDDENGAEDDIEMVKDILSIVHPNIECVKLDAENVTRMGKNKRPGHTRPIKVQFHDFDIKGMVFRNSAKLKAYDKYKNVNISGDKTSKELEEDRQLKAELDRQRVLRPDDDLIIFKKEIIKRADRAAKAAAGALQRTHGRT